MFYVIFDLEWNNVYSRKHKGFFNEIIEIGAVLTDESMLVLDTFSVFVKSQLGKKLTGRTKTLTNISNEDLKSGLTFGRAVGEMKKWLDGRDCVFLSWGNSDVRTFLENYRYFLGSDKITIMKNYADLQKYCQTVMKIDPANQIGLSAAAHLLGIDTGKYSTHRALEDCRISLKCMKKCYDGSLFPGFILKCDDSFYRRLAFKTHFITNINNPRLDRSALKCDCESCGRAATRLSEWKVTGQSFRAMFYCKNCNTLILCGIRFKETFDSISVMSSQKSMQ